MENVTVRKGKKEDVPSALELIRQLARHVKSEPEVTLTVEQMEKDGFGEQALYEFFVADRGGEVLGMALFYPKYSTWKGRCLYLEDLVVSKDARRLGIGSMLFEAVMEESVRIGAKRMEWQLFEWNEEALSFYEKYKANIEKDWLNAKFYEHELKNFTSN